MDEFDDLSHYFDKVARKYGQNYNLEEEVRIKAVDILNRFSKGKLLEVGCGNGTFLEKLTDSQQKIYATEISNSMIKEARRRLKERAIIKKSYNLEIPFPDEYFNYVVCINVLVNLSYKASTNVVSEVLRTTKTKGLILFGFLNKYSPIGLYQYQKTKQKIRCNTYTYKEAKNFFTNYNCSILNVYKISYFNQNKRDISTIRKMLLGIYTLLFNNFFFCPAYIFLIRKN